MNWHEVIDERSHEMDQVIVDILRRSPEKLGLAKHWIEKRMADPQYSAQSKDALQEWLDVMESGGVTGVMAVLSDRGDEAARMRQSSPFGMLMPQEKRLEILTRYEPRRTRAHPASI
jgi:hypothetical protein